MELGIGAGVKKTRMRLPGRERSLRISSAMWIQSTNMTDRWTLDDSIVKIIFMFKNQDV